MFVLVCNSSAALAAWCDWTFLSSDSNSKVIYTYDQTPMESSVQEESVRVDCSVFVYVYFPLCLLSSEIEAECLQSTYEYLVRG